MTPTPEEIEEAIKDFESRAEAYARGLSPMCYFCSVSRKNAAILIDAYRQAQADIQELSEQLCYLSTQSSHEGREEKMTPTPKEIEKALRWADKQGARRIKYFHGTDAELNVRSLETLALAYRQEREHSQETHDRFEKALERIKELEAKLEMHESKWNDDHHACVPILKHKLLVAHEAKIKSLEERLAVVRGALRDICLMTGHLSIPGYGAIFAKARNTLILDESGKEQPKNENDTSEKEPPISDKGSGESEENN